MGGSTARPTGRTGCASGPLAAAAVRFTGLLAAVVVIVTGCGSSAGHGRPALTAGTTAAVTPDPCTVVPAADVARIAHLAAPVTTTTAAGPGAAKICEYHAAISRDRAIVGALRSSRTEFDTGRRDAQSRGVQCADVSTGEAAYACGDPGRYVVVNVFVHGLVLSVQVTRAGREQPAETRALAEFAVTRF